MKLSEEKWLIEQKEFTISGQFETNFTLANGYMGIRGTFEEILPRENSGTFLAGIYDKSEAQVSEFVNLPYFFGLRIYINREYLDLQLCEILDFYRALDMKHGLLYKTIRVKDHKERITKIEGYRFVSQADRHSAGMKYSVIPENYDGIFTIENIIDGTTVNKKNDPKEKVKHFIVKENREINNGIYMEISTREKDYRVGIASSLRVEREGKNAAFGRRAGSFCETAFENVDAEVKSGMAIDTYKYISVVTSRDVEKDVIRKEAENRLDEFLTKNIEKVMEESCKSYEKLWDMTDVEIDGDDAAQKALRFNIFHMMSCVNPEDEKVSIGAKGIHGEGYNGHVFWDTEIFILPFFIYTRPEAARALLMYRYNLLDKARENAGLNGHRGARFPWESADTGIEETPRWGLDYKGNPVRIWTGDIEQHITADVAFSVWEYYRATDDLDFFLNYGAEIFLETARFWSFRAEYNKDLDRYEINDVIGPDEFHEHVNNNLYTNYLAKWNMTQALVILDMVKKNHKSAYEKIVSKTGLTVKELEKWKDVAKKLYIPIKEKLMEQHEGYFSLKDCTVTEYDENNMPLWPPDVDITNLNDYTLIKQADVIMLLHLLGDEFDGETKKINFEYYEKRTMHKSSLSPCLYSLMGLVVGDHSKAYEYFMRTAQVDLKDNQGNTDLGFHGASAGGTWQAVVFGFGGMHINKDGVPGFNPAWIPDKWKSLKFKVYWKGALLKVAITHKGLQVETVRSEK